jgi:hypothetical protein
MGLQKSTRENLLSMSLLNIVWMKTAMIMTDIPRIVFEKDCIAQEELTKITPSPPPKMSPPSDSLMKIAIKLNILAKTQVLACLSLYFISKVMNSHMVDSLVVVVT